MDPVHHANQDTNDRFLANIHRDGTFSVVPRMAAGEVTADGLIAVGQVAKKYNLYTKITGGQRVDLFGAQKQDLPDIWEELVDAGFEWREPGCSMCLAMNPDRLESGEHCASTSNRNFEGRQGAGGRTHLVSPAMAAAAAVNGRFIDVRELIQGAQ